MSPFWNAAGQGRLLLQRCASCGSYSFPALELCRSCFAVRLEWVEASGHASVYSFVVMHQAYHPSFADDIPYAVVDVALEEGPHITSKVVDVAPEDLVIGMKLEVAFEPVDASLALPVFRRASANPHSSLG